MYPLGMRERVVVILGALGVAVLMAAYCADPGGVKGLRYRIVEEETGRPVPGAEVELYSRESGVWVSVARATGDGHGNVWFWGREEDREVRGLARATGYAQESAIQELLNSGAVGLLRKPFVFADLAAAVAAALPRATQPA